MDTTTNKRSVIVGGFVLIGITILVAGIFILGGKQRRFEKTILVTALFDNIGGLKEGNNVWFSGVKIGTVKDIRLAANSKVEVELKLEENVQPYIHKDAQAKLSSESLIGNKIIEITSGSPQSPIIEEGDRLRTAMALSTDDMMATLQESNQNLVSITNDFKVISDRILHGQGTLGTLLTDTSMAENFKAIANNLQRTSATTTHAAASLASFTKKLNSRDGLMNKLVTDTVVFNDLQASIARLQKTAVSAAEISDDLKQVSSKLKDGDNAAGVVLNDPEFAKRLKSTMYNLQNSSEKLDENMEALQHNFLLRGYFRKKAKAEASGNK